MNADFLSVFNGLGKRDREESHRAGAMGTQDRAGEKRYPAISEAVRGKQDSTSDGAGIAHAIFVNQVEQMHSNLGYIATIVLHSLAPPIVACDQEIALYP